ncbi:GNAT family N-acetyltransferase [Schleiferilactobacillus shenzhenensis]|uniref:N-acetyltransferase domain-containing protein n=1 Tax=Schleiferilactobacillus shenzhenensis LY-73 TaxID=1231336 RepID=U4TGP6_9LACO|nr:hypothetical protein L248_1775 [Schleiferilactobacillus shenzhenensis LY-73]
MVIIDSLRASDIEKMAAAFVAQHWASRKAVLWQYLKEQDHGLRQVFVARAPDGDPLGYVTLCPQAANGPFRETGYPEVVDFNVFMPYQHQGIGTQLLAAAETAAAELAPVVTLGVGLHAGYGPAQRLYIRRGYVPDGSGVWYQDQPLPEGAVCRNDDDLVLYMAKNLG